MSATAELQRSSVVGTAKRFLLHPMVVWSLANLIGFVIPALYPFLFFIPPHVGFVTLALMLSVPLAIAQWAALRQLGQGMLAWLATVPAGVFVMQVIITRVPDDFWPDYREGLGAAWLLGLLLGALVAVPQWMILRRRFPTASLWILASAGGLALGSEFLIVSNLINFSPDLSLVLWSLSYALPTGYVLSKVFGLGDHGESSPR